MQTMVVYCAWCKIWLRGDPRIKPGAIKRGVNRAVSHGICRPCGERLLTGEKPPRRTPGPVCQQEDHNVEA